MLHRTEPTEDSKPVEILQIDEIPRRPNQPLQSTVGDEPTNGNGTTVKRKRDDTDEDVEMTNGHAPKKVAGDPSANGDGGKDEPIVLDERGGTILIDD